MTRPDCDNILVISGSKYNLEKFYNDNKNNNSSEFKHLKIPTEYCDNLIVRYLYFLKFENNYDYNKARLINRKILNEDFSKFFNDYLVEYKYVYVFRTKCYPPDNWLNKISRKYKDLNFKLEYSADFYFDSYGFYKFEKGLNSDGRAISHSELVEKYKSSKNMMSNLPTRFKDYLKKNDVRYKCVYQFSDELLQFYFELKYEIEKILKHEVQFYELEYLTRLLKLD